MSIQSNSNKISGMMSVAQNTNAFINKMESIEKDYNKVDSNMQSLSVLISRMMPNIEQNSLSIFENESSIR